VFHRTEKGGRAPLVEVGSNVEAGQVLGYIESVKLWNEILSPGSGVVCQVAAAEGQPVEYGEALFLLEPEPPSPASQRGASGAAHEVESRR